MKESESVKDFSDRLLKVMNKISLLGDNLRDRRVVKKVLITLLEKFVAKISLLEDSRDLSTITLSELVNALHATEQRRLIRQEKQVKGALFVKGKYKAQTSFGVKKQLPEKKRVECSKNAGKSEGYPPCSYCNECTHHMAPDSSNFVELNDAYRSSVKFGNGEYLEVKGVRVIAVKTPSGTKHITDILYVPDIDQNLISVGQLIEKNYTLIFKDKGCTILDTNNQELMTVDMKHRSFPFQ
ncbi:uncharacterized protein LOC111395301 [Olea europaea var. sylvestris]|uniref:uncharacterized protein LOC111395301 n=1 Tax=Olea europaea var. sylvestris TaxID=158386 RepID=UPI000C1D76AD|nr:uncharacterized protein LOC111395301 [Olea europaea var. sylvestris]